MTVATSGDTTTAPITFEQAFAQNPAPSEAESPTADTTSADAPTASSPEAATEPPVDTPSDAAEPRESAGPIPQERHKAILEAERKLRTDLEAKWQRVQWADELANQGVTAEQMRVAHRAYQFSEQDPVRFVEAILSNAAAQPELAQAVRSIAARVLGGRGQQPQQVQPDADAEPQPDLYQQNEDGSRTVVYSAPRQQEREAWFRRQWQAELDQRLGPIEQERQAQAARQQDQRVYSEVQTWGREQLDVFKDKPFYGDLKAGVKAFLDEHGYDPGRLPVAILTVLNTKILPSLGPAERANAIAEMRQQAAASSVSPNAASTSAPKRIDRFDDPSLKW